MADLASDTACQRPKSPGVVNPGSWERDAIPMLFKPKAHYNGRTFHNAGRGAVDFLVNYMGYV